MTKLSWMCEQDDCQLPKEGKTPFCSGHNKALRDIARDLAKPQKPVKSLRRVPVNKVSTKRKEENEEYKFLRAHFLAGNSLCACCGDWATEVHHKKGRENDLLLEVQYFLPVCHGCHVHITEDSAWAIANGFSISRNKILNS